MTRATLYIVVVPTQFASPEEWGTRLARDAIANPGGGADAGTLGWANVRYHGTALHDLRVSACRDERTLARLNKREVGMCHGWTDERCGVGRCACGVVRVCRSARRLVPSFALAVRAHS